MWITRVTCDVGTREPKRTVVWRQKDGPAVEYVVNGVWLDAVGRAAMRFVRSVSGRWVVNRAGSTVRGDGDVEQCGEVWRGVRVFAEGAKTSLEAS